MGSGIKTGNDMRHQKAGRKLGRNSTHRQALLRNLARALFEHERIVTTVEKAKELRPFAEKLITLAKKGTLHARRLALARLPDKDIVKKLFAEYGPRFADRPGGYTRILKRHERRLGDAGKTAFIELLKEGEVKERKEREPQAPAPIVKEEPPAEETPAPQPEESQTESAEEQQAEGSPDEKQDEATSSSESGDSTEEKKDES